MKTYPKIQDTPIKGKRVFIRVDFNVPLESDPVEGLRVADSGRLEGALETIRYVQKQEGKCILASHLGRPKGKPDQKFSMEPVAKKLSEILETDVLLSESVVGDGARGLSQRVRSGEVLLLENLRFHPGEEANGVEFAHKLLELCDVYVNDAFGVLHRAHASTAALPGLVATKAIGFLVQKELHYLTPLRDSPKRPLVLLMGGAKISEKLGVIENLFSRVDCLLIGGAMAYSFLAAEGGKIGKSLCDMEQVKLAENLLHLARSRKVRIQLPCDHLVSSSIHSQQGTMTSGPEIPEDMLGVDIGPRTLLAFQGPLQEAQTIFWNGPMGVFENEAFARGTYELARIVGACKGMKLAGGGDVAAAIARSGAGSQFDFISTGGGATLKFLEGRELPGLRALELSPRTG